MKEINNLAQAKACDYHVAASFSLREKGNFSSIKFLESYTSFILHPE